MVITVDKERPCKSLSGDIKIGDIFAIGLNSNVDMDEIINSDANKYRLPNNCNKSTIGTTKNFYLKLV